MRNSTFSGNFAVRGVSGGAPADPGTDAGGAIFSLNGSTTVHYSTISGNEDTGSGGGLVVQQMTGPTTPPTSLRLRNTIVSNNGVQACAVFGPSPSADGSGNLIQENVNCPGVVSAGDPLLGPLQLNNGITPTMAIPFNNGAAADAADSGTSLAKDQRGVDRPQGSGFDIGAYEACPPLQPPLFLFGGCAHQGTGTTAETEQLTMSVLPVPGGIATPQSGTYLKDSVLAINATPNPGYSFVDWAGNVADPNNPSTFVVMNQPQVVTANFVACVTSLSGRGTAGNSLAPPRVDLTWSASGAHTNILRAAVTGGPYVTVGTSSTTAFTDSGAGLVNNAKAFYVLQLVAANGGEVCRSGELAVTIPRGR